MPFLPMNAAEVKQRGWDEVDFVYVCGDSYVDHPSFGAAIITRVLEDCGFRVAFLAQPNWKNDRDFTQFGKPRLGFMVSAGNIDSMVAHYTVAKRRRHDDAYTAGGKTGSRIRNEENDDKYCCDQCDDVAVVAESLTEKVRQCDRIHFLGVDTKSFCHEKPVEICADRETERRPECFRNTCHQRHCRKSHQEP